MLYKPANARLLSNQGNTAAKLAYELSTEELSVSSLFVDMSVLTQNIKLAI